jgi:hypothetical protein
MESRLKQSSVQSMIDRGAQSIANTSDKNYYGPPPDIGTLQDNHEVFQEAQMLDMINKIQLFQIAGAKVNHALIHRKKSPVFNLSVP